MKKRLLFYQLQPYFEHKNALVITGMRQVGKTTLLKQIFESIEGVFKLWFDFDNPLDQKVFEDIEYRNIYSRLAKMSGNKDQRLAVFIDEIQNFPEITKIIKFLIDHYQVKFFVTGSSSFYLRNLFPESLSGRKFLYELPPLSFQEFLYFHEQISVKELQSHSFTQAFGSKSLMEYKKYSEEYQTYLEFGGFPEVATTPNRATKQLILRNIFASFFEKELRLLGDYKDIRQLRDLILLLSQRVGSLLDVSKVASELRVDRKKIYEYLEFLQGTFFLKLLPKYSKSIDRAVAGGKKVFFSDNGLLRLIGQVNEGQILENSVVNQLSYYGNLAFYHGRNRSEIDIILDKKIALEIKTTATKQDIAKLKNLAALLNLTQVKVVSLNYCEIEDVVYPMFL